MQPKISVVIPYYQREPGILRKAIVSAIRQTVVGPMEIIVVDDSSPVPARDELRELITTNSSQIRIVAQANAGPAACAARGRQAFVLVVTAFRFICPELNLQCPVSAPDG